MKTFWIAMAAVCWVGSAGMFIAGCSNVSEKQVAASREKVMEEQRDAERMQREGMQKVQKAQHELSETRREAFKPVITDAEQSQIRKQQDAVEKARHDAFEANREKTQEVRDAERKAQDTETKFIAQEQQKTFTADAQMRIDNAKKHLDRLKEEASKQEGNAKQATQAKIDSLQLRIDRAKDTTDSAKAAEPAHWTEQRNAAQQALNDMDAEVRKTL